MTESIIQCISRHADIDTRRALGCSPKRLESSPCVPKGPTTTFSYDVSERRLVYREFERYDYCYIEVITDIIPAFEDDHAWILLGGATIYEMMHDAGVTREWMKNVDFLQFYYTAGWPKFKTSDTCVSP